MNVANSKEYGQEESFQKQKTIAENFGESLGKARFFSKNSFNIEYLIKLLETNKDLLEKIQNEGSKNLLEILGSGKKQEIIYWLEEMIFSKEKTEDFKKHQKGIEAIYNQIKAL